MLNEVKIYKPTKDGLKLEKVISREEVGARFDAALMESRSHKSMSPEEYKARFPNAKTMSCEMCGIKFYATNPRNTKFCSQSCGRKMTNVYKQQRKRHAREV